MKKYISNIINDAIKTVYSNKYISNINIEIPEATKGDYSSNIALILAKKVGESPLKVAEKLVNALKDIDSSKEGIFKDITTAKPGFINFHLSIPYLNSKIYQINEKGLNYADNELKKNINVNIEFISANPTGPLTLGNGRGGYAGDVLAKVFEKSSAKVTREYYINDRGGQINALGHSVLNDDQAVYCGSYIDEIATKINQNPPSGGPGKAGREAAKIIVDDFIKPTINKMGIKFDHFISENEIFNEGKVTKEIDNLKKEKLTYEKDGALWLKTSDIYDDKDRVLVTANGEYTYFATDIAYHLDKINRGCDLLIDFWGADHHGYVNRLKSAIEIMKKKNNWDGKIEIIICQLVRLMENGQEIKMSKRAGTYVTLDELIDEVGTDVARFFFLDRSLNTHMDFDLNLAKEKSQKNPVYYVQYAYARIASILAKCHCEKPPLGGDAAIDHERLLHSADASIRNDTLKEKEETELIKELIKLPDIIEEIVEDYQVQKLTYYARQIAEKFHYFYEKCQVIESGDIKLTTARLELLEATKIVLKNTLDLIGVSSPEKM